MNSNPKKPAPRPFVSPVPEAPKKPAPPPPTQGDNALWRVAEWFPTMDPVLLDQLKLYHGELLKFNVKLNLISRQTERDADEVHFADCIFTSQLLEKVQITTPIFDIGSGNGLPGVLMAVLSPSREYFLVESDSRKCEFLKHIIHVLKLKNCTVMNVRLETLKSEEISTAISRGFATVTKAVLSMNKVFSKGGRFFHMKGNSWSTEIAEIPSQLISVWSPELIGEYSLPVSQARRAVVCTTKQN